MKNGALSFIEHIEELRSRLLKCAIAFVASCIGVYSFSERILAFLAKPVGTLVFIDPTEAFIAYLKVTIWGGIFFSSPVIIYQLWRFIGAGLNQNERRVICIWVPASFLLFVCGSAFGFLVIIKLGMKFLLSFGAGFMTPMITISRYVSFISAMTVAFGLVFQLPIVILLLTKFGIVSPQTLAKKRRYAILFIFIAAGILTPGPDIFSQLAMALPLLVLYEASILLARINYARSKAKVFPHLVGVEG